MTLKEMLEQRAKLATQIRSMADKVNAENRDFTAEEKPNWEKVNGDYNTLVRSIEIAERAAKVTSDLDARDGEQPPGREDRDGRETRRQEQNGRPTEEQRGLALRAWFRRQAGQPLTEAEVEACRATGFQPDVRELRIPLLRTTEFQKLQRARQNAHPSQHERALSAVNLSTGGVTVPETLIRQLEVTMLAFGGVLGTSEVIRTATGERMLWPTANDTSNSGRQLGESGAITATAQPSFAAVAWDAYKFTSDEILVPSELLEDSVFDIPSVIGAMLGERLGRILATKFATGSGASTPKGLVTATSAATLSTGSAFTASATAIAPDELFDLVHSIDLAYRMGAGFLMHDNVLLYLRKLKDTTNQYLWQSGMAEGQPDRLLGYPVNICQEMASSVVADAKTVLFGQLSKYKVRQVNEVRLYRLLERHRENDQDAFLAFVRADGNLLTGGTAPVKHLLQHA